MIPICTRLIEILDYIYRIPTSQDLFNKITETYILLDNNVFNIYPINI